MKTPFNDSMWSSIVIYGILKGPLDVDFFNYGYFNRGWLPATDSGEWFVTFCPQPQAASLAGVVNYYLTMVNCPLKLIFDFLISAGRS